jgi:mono/diheme cytochrome c family protein
MINAPKSLKLLGLLAVLAAVPAITGAAIGATAPTKTQIAAGKTVFKSAGCGKCHTLKAVHAAGTAGPNLDTHHYPMAAIVNQVTNGGRFMPPFAMSKGGTLSPTQIKNVAAFVYANEHK